MLTVFVDTVAWIALINTRDSLYEKAKKVFANLRLQNYKFITTEFVLLELANALSAPAFRETTANFIYGLKETNEVDIVEASSDLFSRGLELYQNRPDKEWSLVDCISFVIMTENVIVEAFTSDHHFEQANFRILL